MTIRSWSLVRVLLVSAILFVLAIPACIAVDVAIDGVSSGSGGIGTVSVGINPITLALPFIAPLMLVTVWLYARRR